MVLSIHTKGRKGGEASTLKLEENECQLAKKHSAQSVTSKRLDREREIARAYIIADMSKGSGPQMLELFHATRKAHTCDQD